MPTVAISNFVRRQTAKSRFSYFAGSDEDLVQRVQANFAKAAQGYRAGVLLVPVEPEGFFSGTVRLQPGDKLAGTYEARQPGEQPRKAVGVVGGEKLPAKQVKIVLYSRETLAEGNENTPGSCPTCGNPDYPDVSNYPTRYADCTVCGGSGLADWEIISLNATSTDEDEPMPVGTLLHNHFHVAGSNDGGTSTGMSDADFIAALRRSFEYWRDKATVAVP